MPFASAKICSRSGCFKVVRDTRYCLAHTQYEQPFQQMNVTAEQRKFYNSKAWEKLRQVFLIENPFCVHCEHEHITRLADHCDHIKPIRTHWHLRLEWSNLQSLCLTCHSSKTGRAGISN